MVECIDEILNKISVLSEQIENAICSNKYDELTNLNIALGKLLEKRDIIQHKLNKA